MKSKRFEERPVLEVVGVSRPITNTGIPLLICNSRNQLRDATRQAALQHAGIQVRDSQAEAFGRESAAQEGDPLAAANVGILAFCGSHAQGPVCTPLRQNRAERKKSLSPSIASSSASKVRSGRYRARVSMKQETSWLEAYRTR